MAVKLNFFSKRYIQGEVGTMDTIIVYTSMTGTTEAMAEEIGKKLTESGENVVIKDALEVLATELLAYELIIIGSYTWGDGELPDEMAAFYEEVMETDLTGKMAAVFGPGDSTYYQFAHAVDLWEEALKQQGAVILTEGLKVDRWAFEDTEVVCSHFCDEIFKKTIKLVPHQFIKNSAHVK
jgi:flavodoxin I